MKTFIKNYSKSDLHQIISISKNLPEYFSEQGIKEIHDLLNNIQLPEKEMFCQVAYVSNENANDEIIGFVIYSLQNEKCVVHYMGVQKSFQKNNIGSRLLDKVVINICAKNILLNRSTKSIEVSTLADSVDYAPYVATRNFYRKYGFKDLTTIKHPDNPEWEEELILSYKINENEMKLEEATLDDARGIAEVHVTSWNETYPNLLPQKLIEDRNVEKSTKMWEGTINKTNSDSRTIFVLKFRNRIVGFICCCNARENIKSLGLDALKCGEISALYLLKEYQGSCLGKILFDKARSYFSNNNYDKFYLWVLNNNTTEEFYKKMYGIKFNHKIERLIKYNFDMLENAYLFNNKQSIN